MKGVFFMKRLFAFLLACAMLILIASCEQTPSETTDRTPSETTTEIPVIPEPYKPTGLPSDIFKTALTNPEYDFEHYIEYMEPFSDGKVTLGTVIVDEHLLKQEDEDAVFAVYVVAAEAFRDGVSAIRSLDLAVYLMQCGYKTLERGQGVYVAMTKEEIENFEGRVDWAFLLIWRGEKDLHPTGTNDFESELLDNATEDQKLYVTIEAFYEFDTLVRRLALCEYYGDEVDINTFNEEIFIPANTALLADCGLLEVAEEQEAKLNHQIFALWLTKAQIEALLDSDLLRNIEVKEKPSHPTPTA
jgi:hypothetical protein